MSALCHALHVSTVGKFYSVQRFAVRRVRWGFWLPPNKSTLLPPFLIHIAGAHISR